jgi:integrase/recombinase XerD
MQNHGITHNVSEMLQNCLRISGDQQIQAFQGRKKRMYKFNPPKIKLSSYLKGNGTRAVNMQVIIARKPCPIPLNLDVRAQDFDEGRGFMRVKSEEADKANLVILKAIKKVTEIYDEYRQSGQELTLAIFLNEYYNWEHRDNFIAFARAINKQRLKDQVIELKTHNQHGYMLDKLEKFRDTIVMSDLTPDFIKDFNRYLISIKNSSSTRCKDLTNLKFYVNILLKDRPKMKDPFEGFDMPALLKRIVFLSKDELVRVYNYYKSYNIPDNHKKALRYWLLMAFTSLRATDALRLRKSCIHGDMIVFIPEKNKHKRNGVPLSIPLTDIAREFICEHGELLVDKTTNMHTCNDLYKDIAKLLGIQKNISNHVARHTFGTQFVINGGAVTTLQLIMDHSDIDDTMVYVHVTAEDKKNGMNSAFKNFFTKDLEVKVMDAARMVNMDVTDKEKNFIMEYEEYLSWLPMAERPGLNETYRKSIRERLRLFENTYSEFLTDKIDTIND